MNVSWRLSSSFLLFYLAATPGRSSAFMPHTLQSSSKSSPPTALSLVGPQLLDVPDHFFTLTMAASGLILSFTKSFGRVRLEQRAWERRLAEGRERRLRQDPRLTEQELLRREAELEWSAYGPARMQAEAAQKELDRRERELRQANAGGSSGRGRRVQVMERERDDEEEEEDENQKFFMSEREIDLFETEFGIDYDPYYDDPYTEDELPEGKYQVDKNYGDRIYEDGEIFYKDAQSKLYYRQGARPRTISFFSP